MTVRTSVRIRSRIPPPWFPETNGYVPREYMVFIKIGIEFKIKNAKSIQ
jgi:hypothetical protein